MTEQLAHRVQSLVERVRTAPGVPRPQVLLSTPAGDIASGDRSRRFHAASVGKLATAVLARRLARAGRLDLDAPIHDHLDAALTAGLFRQPAAVTARHLLRHTSGADDYFGGRASGHSFRALVRREPQRAWTPDALLAFARERQRPFADPGARFRYSDTGYLVLGRLIEAAGGASLHHQLHEHIFGPVGMEDSCLLHHTMPGGGDSVAHPADELDLAPMLIEGMDVSRSPLLAGDWSGGGIATTLDDLIRFSRALHDGTLLTSTELAESAVVRSRFRPGIAYGEGMMVLRYGGFSPFLARMPHALGHLGVTSVHLFAVAGRGVHLAMNLHDTRAMVRGFRLHIDVMRAALAADRVSGVG